MLRHMNPLLCGVYAEACMLVHRFDIQARSPPTALTCGSPSPCMRAAALVLMF